VRPLVPFDPAIVPDLHREIRDRRPRAYALH
jgi:hypothetical protein